jgi:hypothetical protein
VGWSAGGGCHPRQRNPSPPKAASLVAGFALGLDPDAAHFVLGHGAQRQLCHLPPECFEEQGGLLAGNRDGSAPSQADGPYILLTSIQVDSSGREAPPGSCKRWCLQARASRGAAASAMPRGERGRAERGEGAERPAREPMGRASGRTPRGVEASGQGAKRPRRESEAAEPRGKPRRSRGSSKKKGGGPRTAPCDVSEDPGQRAALRRASSSTAQTDALASTSPWQQLLKHQHPSVFPAKVASLSSESSPLLILSQSSAL